MTGIFKNSLRVFLYFILAFAVLEVVGAGRIKIQLKFIVITISWMIMLYGLLKYRPGKAIHFSTWDKVVLCLLLVWNVANIIRSVDVPLQKPATLLRYLGDPLFSAAALVPFFVFYGGRVMVWKEVWTMAKPFVRWFLVLSPLLFVYTRQYIHLAFFIPLLLLNWGELEKRDRVVLILSFLAACAYAAVKSERYLFVHFSFFPIAYFLLILFNKAPNRLTRVAVMSLLLGACFAFFALLYLGYVSPLVTDPVIKANLQGFEADNFNSTTHDLVFEDFFLDFDKTSDWFFGRGVLGNTYSEQFITIQDMTDTEKNIFDLPIGYRTEVECGYLMMILKSGVLGLILFYLVALSAIFKGLFRSNNVFVKGCAWIIAEWLIIMYPFGWPEYSICYILVWLCVGACLSKEMRLYSDADLRFQVFQKQQAKTVFLKKASAPLPREKEPAAKSKGLLASISPV